MKNYSLLINVTPSYLENFKSEGPSQHKQASCPSTAGIIITWHQASRNVGESKIINSFSMH